MPTMCMPVAALPGSRLLKSLDRYFVQSSVRTLANLSRPNRIGATVNAMRNSRNAWATGSSRNSFERGNGTGRSVAATVLMWLSSMRGQWVTPSFAPRDAPVLRRAAHEPTGYQAMPGATSGPAQVVWSSVPRCQTPTPPRPRSRASAKRSPIARLSRYQTVWVWPPAL